jgi:hypothetical protein
MSISQRLDGDLKQAIKQRDQARVDCIRMLKSKLLERQVALRSKHGTDYEITDDEALGVLTTYAKQRRESIEGFRRGGRDDLATAEEAELEIVRGYLPERLGEAELRGLVEEAIAETDAKSVKDLGAVMKAVMPKVKGAADGKQVQQLVRTLLTPPPDQND